VLFTDSTAPFACLYALASDRPTALNEENQMHLWIILNYDSDYVKMQL
jgi:hypothetical protein